MTANNWIFIRGLTRGNIHWADFPEVFLSLNPSAKIEFLEIPGNGELYHLSSPMNVKKLISYFRKQSQFIQLNKPIRLCGISLGGMIAMKWAELFPTEVQSVSVINTSLNQFSPFYQRLKLKNYPAILKSLLFVQAKNQEEVILSMTSNDQAKIQKHLKSFQFFAEKHPMQTLNFIRQLILANHIRIEKLPKIPLQVISSKNDRLVDANCTHKISHKFHGTEYMHPTAGHDLPLDDPQWLTNILLQIETI